MKEVALNPAHQLTIIMRLNDFCRWGRTMRHHEHDEWNYMREKLLATEDALTSLKTELLEATGRALLAEMGKGEMTEERYADYRHLMERLLSRGDYVDVAVHLTTAGGGSPAAINWLGGLIAGLKPTTLFVEEKKPLADRSASWEKLVNEMSKRVGLDLLAAVLEHKPITPKRRSTILRRLRQDVKEYCAVVSIPMDAKDTFTPFMLTRIEALIAANLRFLNKYR
jgi:hypothetical protein